MEYNTTLNNNNMKKKIRYKVSATRGGFLTEVLPITGKVARIKLETDIIQELYVGERGTPIKAVNKPDTLFTGWSDGVKANPRTLTGNKNDAPGVVIIANFKLKYTLWERLRNWIWGRRNPLKWR